jgi:hypothetical protein
MHDDHTIACSGSKASHSVPLIRSDENVLWYSSVSTGIVATAKDIPLCCRVLPNCLMAFETALKILGALEGVGWRDVARDEVARRRVINGNDMVVLEGGALIRL